MSSSVFGDVEKAGEACAVAAQLDVLPDLYGEELALGLPGHTNLSDVNIVAELGLEENGVSGIWLRREWSIFLITVEPFRIAYSEIEETKVKGMGTGSLFLKVRGQWKPVPVERGREVKERIDRRRAAG